LGVTIVEPSTAIAHLLDHFVRSPSAASLLLGLDKNQAIAEVQLQNIALQGMALRELRLPIDVLILSVRRKGSALISHGYTQLEVGDWVTVVGSPEGVNEVINRFGPV
jgi:Trk K+ transport system NAD-binding subunit